ncbi:MAG: hypothetical protein H6738_16310 [Alphaproteobacteria bacterium]|nr:hypothetical protein [Alphaproteobacteria bacterium]MCB9698344.1 hypothetical protein [Alphaproteobacteria bacterium]
MSLWVGLIIAAFLLLMGFLGLVGGGLLVFQQIRRRNAAKAARARRAAMAAQLPVASTRVYNSADRPTVPMMVSPVGERRPGQQVTSSSPTLLPDVLDDDDEVPTGVFKPSQYRDIDAMLKEADKYVTSHRKTAEKGEG